MLTFHPPGPPPPPVLTQHATTWILHEWNSPHRHGVERVSCDFREKPGECDRISGIYREGLYFMYVSAERKTPDDPVRVVVCNPIYNPPPDGQPTKSTMAQYALQGLLTVVGAGKAGK
jgi:hypothetical protein